MRLIRTALSLSLAALLTASFSEAQVVDGAPGGTVQTDSFLGSVGGAIKHGAEDAADGIKHGAEDAYDFAKHGFEDAEKAGKKAGEEMSDAAKKGLKALKGLLNPCNSCKMGVKAGLEEFSCGMTASAIVKEGEKCEASVLETVPEYAEYSAEICTAAKAAVKDECKEMGSEKHVKKALDRTSESMCKAIHLCS